MQDIETKDLNENSFMDEIEEIGVNSTAKYKR